MEFNNLVIYTDSHSSICNLLNSIENYSKKINIHPDKVKTKETYLIVQDNLRIRSNKVPDNVAKGVS